MSNIVKYNGLTMEALATVDAQVQDIAGGDFETIEVGENVFRFLPVMDGNPVRVTAMHYIDAIPGLGKMVVFACPRVELKQPCIACQKSEELSKTGNPADRERAYKISAGLRVYANVLNRKKPDAGPRVLAFGKQIWAQLKTIRENKRMGGDYTDPTEAGFDIIIMREGTGKDDTKYTVSADRSNSPLAASVEEINQIISSTKDLEQYVVPVPADELLAAWGGSSRQVASAPAATRQMASGTVGAGVMSRAAANKAHQGQVVASIPKAAVAASAVQDAELDDDFNPIGG